MAQNNKIVPLDQSMISLPLGIISAATLLIRIRYEEEMLLQGMAGYTEYRERVRYKLIPGVF